MPWVPSSFSWSRLCRISAGAIALGGLCVAFVPRPLEALRTFSPFPLIYGLLGLLLCILAWPLLRRALNAACAVPWRWYAGLWTAVAFGASLLVNQWVFQGLPHVSDSITYLFMAKTFATGHLSLPPHPWPEFVTYHFFIHDEAWFGIFPPGWPLVLALGVLVRAPFLAPPLLSALLVWQAMELSRRLMDEPTARLTPLLLVGSPFFLYQGAEYMSHPLAAVLFLGLLLLAVGAGSRGRLTTGASLLAGLCLGLLVLTRPVEGVASLGLFGLWAALRGRKLEGRLLLLVPLAAALLAMALLGAYNRHFTGSAYLFPQERYFALADTNPRCHRLGFGKDIGCISEHGPDVYEDGYYLAEALKTTRSRLDSLYTHFLGLPLAVLLAPLALAARRRRRENLALLSLFGLYLAVYGLFYYHGNCYGPRFVYPVFPLLAIMAASSLRSIGKGGLDPTAGGGVKARAVLAFAVMFTVLGVGFRVSVPSLGATYHHFRGIDRRVEQAAKNAGLTKAVVFIPGNDVDYGLGFIFNDPDLYDPVIYARSWGDQDGLLCAFTGRTGYRWRDFDRRLLPVPAWDPATPLRVEGESRQNAMHWCEGCEKPFTAYLPDQGIMDADDDRALYFSGSAPGQWFDIRLSLFAAGCYDLDINCLKAFYSADFELLLDGRSLGEVNASTGDDPFLQRVRFDGLQLDRGVHVLRFVARSVSTVPGVCGIGVDYLEFSPCSSDETK